MGNIIDTLKERLFGARLTSKSMNYAAEIATSERPSLTAPYPHCDKDILHAPGSCVFCDKFPDAQAARIYGRVNFTGTQDPELLPDPAQVRRPLEVINRWGNNRPTTQKQLDEEQRAWEQFSREWEEAFGEDNPLGPQ